MSRKRQPLPKQTTREGDALRLSISSREDFDHGQHDADVAMARATDGDDDDIPVSAGSTVTIYHGLGHVPEGWRITDKTKAGDFWRNSWDSEQIELETDAAGDLVIRLEVF